MRDQAIFLGLNYLAALMVAGALGAIFSAPLPPATPVFITAIMITDNFANATYINMNSLGQPVTANILLFVRAGLWVVPVIALGSYDAGYRHADTVLACWLGGIGASLLLTFFVWRKLPWRSLRSLPVDWRWIGHSVKKSFFIWLGTLGLAGGVYVDRFVVERDLGLMQVGIATFYFSFANALFTLIQNGVLAFTYPRLIALQTARDFTGFQKEARQSLWHVGLLASLLVILLGAGVPALGPLFHHPEFAREASTLWLMLAAVWLRAHAETFYYILFARHQDRAIWTGNLLFLLPAIGGNLVLVPLLGLSGIGVSALLAAGFLWLWRRQAARSGTTEHTWIG